jgi:hypothetical protein
LLKPAGTSPAGFVLRSAAERFSARAKLIQNHLLHRTRIHARGSEFTWEFPCVDSRKFHSAAIVMPHTLDD